MPVRPGSGRRRSSAASAGEAGDLLASFRQGDEAAFEGIVGEYHVRLIQFFYRLCWDRDRAEDFTQELFIKLLKGAHRYRSQGKLSTFIFRVATNLWIDHYRSIRPQPRLYSLDKAVHGSEGREGSQAGSVPAKDAGPVERTIDDEDKRRLRAALECLTEPHRIVFELAVYQEMSYPEISSVLEIPVGTIKSRMHNSVKALKAMLRDDEDAGSEGDERRSFLDGGKRG